MQFTLKRPCPGCPFSTGPKAVRFLGRARAQQIVDSLVDQDATFSCHETNLYDDEGEARETRDSQHCAGAMILLMRLEMPNQMMRIAGRIGSFDPDSLDMESPVFANFDEFVDAQADGARR